MLTDHVQLCNSNPLSIAMYLICGINFISVTCLLLGVAIFINSSVYTELMFSNLSLPRLIIFYYFILGLLLDVFPLVPLQESS
ncbi:hypothetical protein C0J52_12314 [Blattella germanica]|nr:hypothetical protein C0J52_12314 [Blattella germanica]